MTYGLQTINDSGVLNIDENLKTYVYLGKYAIPDQIGMDVTIDIVCNGYPLIYFSIPQGDANRTGIAMTKLAFVVGNQWKVSFTLHNPAFLNLGLFMRVFGRLDLNYPSGSGAQFGMLVWNEAGQLVFDSNLPMHRLAGNTYDTELVLVFDVPTPTDPVNKHDHSYTLPFNMTGKSISANCRGMIYYPEYKGSYVDWDTGENIDQYDVGNFVSLYWYNGNDLVIGRVRFAGRSFETTGPVVIDYSNCHLVYSRLAVIDNNLFA